MMIPESTSLLAIGGVAALVTAGWQKIKSIFSSLSGFIVIRASFDSHVTRAIRFNLDSYKELPGSSFSFIGARLPVISRLNFGFSTVPFKFNARTRILYKRWSVLFITDDQNICDIISIRGLVNFETLVKESIVRLQQDTDFATSNSIKKMMTTDNFFIKDFSGEEKGAWAHDKAQNTRGVGNNPQGSDSLAPASSRLVDLSLDRSFMYSIEDYSTKIQDTSPFDKLHYPSDIMRKVKDIKNWYSMRDWYSERDIPWRRGILFHGPYGTGKSSLCKAIAQDLGIPIYRYFLNTLSDQEFMHCWSQMQLPCSVLFEDFHTVFHGSVSVTQHKSLTFECVLNTIAGISNESGILLMINTNDISLIDPALGTQTIIDGQEVSTRPGRIDALCYVGPMDEAHKLLMANSILRDWPEEIEPLLNKFSGEMTPPQFREVCCQVAYRRIRDNQFVMPSLGGGQMGLADVGEGTLDAYKYRS